MATLVDQKIGPIGYGLMGLTWRAEPPSQSQAFAAMDAALAAGANFWNGGELYGSPERNSLHLLHEYFTTHPERASQIVLSIKGGIVPGEHRPDGGEANVRRSVDECVRVLEGKKSVDIFECARVDPKTPIEETVRVLAECVKEGKIKGIGLSEVRAETIRRAHKVHPIAAVEVELSLWATDILRNGVAATCAELQIPIVAYSPLMRGALTGEFPNSNAEIPKDDFRKHLPKFQDDVLSTNMRLTQEVEKLAHKKGCTKAQVAIAWVRGCSGRNGLGTIIPIPGATTEARVMENSKDVTLSEADMEEIDEILSKYGVTGPRYAGPVAALSEG